MAKDNDYGRGLRDGKTAATLEGIAATQDEMRDDMAYLRKRFDTLPCGDQVSKIDRALLWVRLQWGILISMLLGLIAWMCKQK